MEAGYKSIPLICESQLTYHYLDGLVDPKQEERNQWASNQVNDLYLLLLTSENTIPALPVIMNTFENGVETVTHYAIEFIKREENKDGFYCIYEIRGEKAVDKYVQVSVNEVIDKLIGDEKNKITRNREG